MSIIETKGGKATLESWVNISAMEDKLQLDRVSMLFSGKPWKVKYRTLQIKDKACKTITKKMRNKQVNTHDYLKRVVEIMGDY